MMSPIGKTYKQNMAYDLSLKKHIIIICGHYEGFDERIRSIVDLEISIGGYEYDNGYYMSCMLCSGASNYYENYVLYDENGNEIWYNDLCDYMIEDFSVETENGDIYGIRFKEV